MPELAKRVEEFHLSTYRKYKLSYCKLNIDLIIFFRLRKWNFKDAESVNSIFFVVSIPNEL